MVVRILVPGYNFPVGMKLLIPDDDDCIWRDAAAAADATAAGMCDTDEVVVLLGGGGSLRRSGSSTRRSFCGGGLGGISCELGPLASRSLVLASSSKVSISICCLMRSLTER